jgi:CheY-like chemotaxis protein
MAEAFQKKILVVDDNEEELGLVVGILERANYEVISATSGKEAIELAKDQPDLIILDIVLPDIDGGEVASKLSEDPAYADIPIIFLTGIIKKTEEYDEMKTGRRYVLAKPVTKDGLLKTINQVLLG